MRKRTSGWVLPTCTVCVVLATAPLASAERPAAAQWLAPVWLSTSSSEASAVAVNERGDAIVAWSEVPSGRIVARYRAADSTWSEPTALGTRGGDNPVVAIDVHGNAIAAWASFGTDPVVLTASRSSVSGQWTEPARISESRVDRPGDVGVVFDAAGDATASWVRSADGYDNALETAYKPVGGVWARPVTVVRVPAPTIINGGVALATNATTALVAWQEQLSSDEARVRAAVGHNGTWEPAKTLATGIDAHFYSGATAAIGQDGTSVVGWNTTEHGNHMTQASVRRAGAASWGAPATLSFEDGQSYGIDVAVDGHGNATAVWATYVDYEASYLATGSERWQRPVAITSPVSGRAAWALNQAGDVVFVWIDGKLMAKTLRAGVSDWDPPVAISPDVPPYLQLGVSLDPAGDAMVAWGSLSPPKGVFLVTLDAAAPELESLRAPTRGRAGKSLNFSASFRDISATTIRWSFGSGTTARRTKVRHIFRRPGVFILTVTATDAAGHATQVSRRVRIGR